MAALRNAFYVGQYKRVLVDAKNQKENAAAADVLFYRAMIALGAEEQCMKAIGNAQAPELQALKMYATYRAANEDNKELVLEKLKDLCKEQWTPESTTPATVQLCAALMWFESRNYKEALRLVHKGHENLEHMALAVQIYIRIDRLDLAAKQVKAMQDVDDDDALTALASVWLYLAVGGDKAQEAFHLLEELVEKFQPSITLLNLMATCKIAAKEYAAAFQYTRQAKELAVANKEKISPETLSNTVVCMQHLHKPQIVAQVTAELKAAHPTNAWLQRQQAMESVFDKLAVQYAAGTTGIPAAAGAGAASPVAAAGAGAAAAAKK